MQRLVDLLCLCSAFKWCVILRSQWRRRICIEILRLRLIYESFVKGGHFPVKRLPGTPLPVVRTSNPILSDSSIRRLMRQRNFPQRCRNQNAGLDGPMSRARLALRGRHRFPIGFSFFKHPKARLRKVASHGHFGFAMAAARFNPLVKSADMIVATALAIENRAVGSFHKGPLQIHIDISTNRSVVKFPPAGVLTRHQPAVASELLSTGETLHSPNLGPNHHCQDISHSRQTLKQVCFSPWSESLHHLRFDHFKILIDMIELPEHPSNCLFSIGRKLDQNSLHNRTSFFAKSITCLFNHKPVLPEPTKGESKPSATFPSFAVGSSLWHRACRFCSHCPSSVSPAVH